MAALGVAELLAGLLRAGTSLVVAIGGAVIDLAPPFVKDIAISSLREADKPALVIGVVVVTIAIGAILGRLSLRSMSGAIAGFVALGVVGGVAAVPRTSPIAAVVMAVGATIAAVAVLTRMGRTTSVQPDGDRRWFLTQAGAVVAFGGLSAVVGRSLVRLSATTGARNAVELQTVGSTVAPAVPSLDVGGISPLYVPNDRFYRVDTVLSTPMVDVDTWTLTVKGLVERPFSITFDELLSMPMVERDVTLACVSNEVGDRFVGNARWQGVPLADLLDRAGVLPEADQVVGRSVDDFTVGFPTGVALDGRTAMVAVGMNGEPLPIAHGFPARLVVAGLYGYVSATKWLSEIELTTWDGFDAYWVPRGWAKEAPIKTQSRIDVPAPGWKVFEGRRPIAGVAWAPGRGISKVEVRVDDGPWLEARLGADAGEESWRQWVLEWDATFGAHSITVRATDGDGVLQEEREQPPRPDGATGWHTMEVSVQRA